MASVLLCALSATGSARYFVSIAATLVARGHEVTVISSPSAASHFRGLPVRFEPVDEPAIPGRFQHPPRGPRQTRATVLRIRDRYISPMDAQWAAIQRVLNSARVDVVLTEQLFLGAMALAYLPRPDRPLVVGLGTIPVVTSGPSVPPYGSGVSPRGHTPGVVITAALELANARLYAMGGTEFQDRVEHLTGTRPHPDIRRLPAKADIFAQLSVARFEYARATMPANFRFIGPLHPVGEDPIPAWWDPNREPRIVAVKFAEGAELTDLVIPAIRAFSDDEVTVIIAGVERETVEQAYGRRLASNIHFEASMPWPRLLLGRSVLVSAGDYLPVQYALRSGTPIVAAGKRTSQVETAARVEWSGAGVRLRPHDPSPATLRSAVLRAFDDAGIRRAVARIAAQIAATNAEATLATIVETLQAPSEERVTFATTA